MTLYNVVRACCVCAALDDDALAYSVDPAACYRPPPDVLPTTTTSSATPAASTSPPVVVPTTTAATTSIYSGNEHIYIIEG